MTKYTLIGLLAVCATVLCFSLIFREQLCELNIHRGNTVVQVTSGLTPLIQGGGGALCPGFPEV
ncbi:Hok/Gef family protein (plasmid) [Escherichia coli]